MSFLNYFPGVFIISRGGVTRKGGNCVAVLFLVLAVAQQREQEKISTEYLEHTFWLCIRTIVVHIMHIMIMALF